MPVEEKRPFLDMAETLKRQYHINRPEHKLKSSQHTTNQEETTSEKNYFFACLFSLLSIFIF